MTQLTAIPRVPRRSRIRDAILSLTRPPAIANEKRDAVIERYELDVVGDRNVRHNRRSSNLIVETTRGRLILKRYRPEWKPTTVTCVHSTLNRLEELDEPAPRLIRTREGADWIEDDDGVFAVFEFIDGVSFASTYLFRRHRLRITARAAQALARMHIALVDFSPQGEHHHGIDPETGLQRRDLAWHVEMVKQLKELSEQITSPNDRELAHLLSQQSSRLLDLLTELDDVVTAAHLPTTVIHGDFGIHNLIFPPKSPPVPIDYELSRRDWRVNDLISATGKHRFKDGSYDRQAMRVFLKAYEQSSPLTEEERAVMPMAWAHYKLRAAVQYWNSYHQTDGPIRKLRSALDSMSQAQEVLDDPNSIRSLVDG